MSEPPIETGVGEVQPKPRKTGHQWFDLIMAVSAISISVISLFVAIEHGKTERELVAASAWPFLRVINSNSYGPDSDIAIGVSNGGVGPAKIESFEVFYKGQPVSSGVDLLAKCCSLSRDKALWREQLPRAYYAAAAQKTVVRPGEDKPVTWLKRTPEGYPVANRFANALSDIRYSVCYCSILDQCWTSDLKDTRTTPVKTCPTPKVAYDPNGK